MTSATAEMAHAGASGFQSSAPACVTANALPTQGMNRPPSARVPSRAGEAPIGDVAGALDRVSAAVWRAFVAAERGALTALEGSCRTAIGAYATVEGDRVHLVVEALTPRGEQRFRREGEARADKRAAAELGLELGQAIKAKAGDALFA